MAGNDLNFRNLSSVVNGLVRSMQGITSEAHNIPTKSYISSGEVIESDSIDTPILTDEEGDRLLTENGEYIVFE